VTAGRRHASDATNKALQLDVLKKHRRRRGVL